MKKNYTKDICFCALFVAIVCACTLISVPLPIGYFNLGDVAVLTAAFLLGAVKGGMAAAFGSALADILLGAALYAPATLVIKGVVAIVAALLYAVMKNTIFKKRFDLISMLISAAVAEIFMVAGYFAYEAVILGYGLGAAVSIAGNSLQAVCGVIGGVLLSFALRSAKINRR